MNRVIEKGYRYSCSARWEIGICLILAGLKMIPEGASRDLLHIKLVEGLIEAKKEGKDAAS